MSVPTVTVLLATRDGAQHLPEQLASITAQTESSWRIVTADDGSNDDTATLMAAFAEVHPDQVVILDRDPVGSARDNFFRLLRRADNADYYAFCDQDDVWAADKLEILVRRCRELEAEASGDPCLVFSDLAVVDAYLKILHPSFLGQMRTRPEEITYKTLLVENAVPGCSMLFNAALAEVFRSRTFDQERAIMHDWWVALLAAATGRISYVPVPLVSYRQHAANTLGAVDRSGLSFALSKLLLGDRFATTAVYLQAAEFANAYGDLLDPPVADTVRVLGSLTAQSKPGRIRKLLKHGALKQTAARRAYQLLRA